MIDRRAFLRRLGFGTVSAAAAVCTFDVDKLLWVPGQKTISLPPVSSLAFYPRAFEFVMAPLVLNEQAMRALVAANRNLFNPKRDLFAMRRAI